MTRNRDENAEDLRHEERLAEAEKVLLRVPEMVPSEAVDFCDFVSNAIENPRARAEMLEGFGSSSDGMVLLYHVAMEMIEHRNETDINPILTAMMRERFPQMAPDAVVVDSDSGAGGVTVGVMRADRDDGYISSTFTMEEVNEFTERYQAKLNASPSTEPTP